MNEIALWTCLMLLALAVPVGVSPQLETVRCAAPKTRGGMSVTEAIATRRSRREFRDQRLTPAEIAHLCWAGQGITDPSQGLRASPSAGALYPMTIFVADADGVWEYLPAEHALRLRIEDDVRARLQRAALNQTCVGDAPVCMLIAMNVGRTARKYGEWAERYCLMEAGHIAQNVLLQATAMKLGGVPVGAFNTERVNSILQLPGKLEVVYLLPLGHPG